MLSDVGKRHVKFDLENWILLVKSYEIIFGVRVLKISWLLSESKYILCTKVENFEKFQKSLKCCSFINNEDNELRLGVF